MQRFEATRASKSSGLVGVLGLLVLVPLGALGALFPSVGRMIMPWAIGVFLVGYFVVMAFVFRTRPLGLEVAGGQLIVDDGRGGRYALDAASIGTWVQPGFGVVGGSILTFRNTTSQFRLLGQDFRIPDGVLATEAPGAEVDAQLPAEAFAELFALTSLARAPRPPVSRSLRCSLLRNPSSAGGAFRTILPWLIAMGIVIVLGVATGFLVERVGPAALWVSTPVMFGTLLAGIAAVFVQQRRRRVPSLEIELDPHQLRIHENGKGLVFSAGRGSLDVLRHRHGLSHGYGFYPSITLTAAGHPPLHIGVYDPRFGWTDEVASAWSAPTYLVGAPDWNALMDALALRHLSK